MTRVNSFSTIFQTTFVCFSVLNKLSLERHLYVKLKDGMSNSIDPDKTAHYEPSHQDLHCLQKPIVITYGSERVDALHAGWKFEQMTESEFFFLFFPQKIGFDISCRLSLKACIGSEQHYPSLLGTQVFRLIVDAHMVPYVRFHLKHILCTMLFPTNINL